MRILFIGYLNPYERSFLRYRALLRLGHEVAAFSMVPVPSYPGFTPVSWWDRIASKLRLPRDRMNINKIIRRSISDQSFDIVWIEKGNTVWPGTLKIIRKKYPQTRILSVSEDDMYATHNRSLYYTWSLSYYDVVFTTKKCNLEELKRIGAKRTSLFLDSYDEEVHRPASLSLEDRKKFSTGVGFIGTFERDRAEQMAYLAEHGIPVVVWGNGWESYVNRHQNLIVKNQPLYGEDYVKAINATKINLCFLRKINRDEITSRSVEIPASGGFMLAERTVRHLDIFEEDKEAVFFSNREELLEKVKKYLRDDGARVRIAEAGRERCLRSGYEVKVQMKKLLDVVSSL